MAVIRVPRTPRRAFDPGRRPSALLLDQIRHLEWAALPASQRKPSAIKKYPKVKTEAQAAERVAALTSMILKAKEDALAEPAPNTGTQRRVKLPPLPKISRPKRKMARPAKRRGAAKRPSKRAKR
jgi:hypothetical protein